MARTIRLPLGEKDVDLPLPEDWEVVKTLEPESAEGLLDVRAGLVEALEHPIGCEPLGSRDLAGRRIVLAVDDITRPTPTHLFFGALVDHLVEHGARREDMLVLLGLGIHRDMTPEEVDLKLGARAVKGLKWVNHDSHDPKACVDLGTTSRGTPVMLNRHLAEADLIVCVGAIEPHLLLGFGGGLKMILPGLAHADTIARNHMQGVSPERFNYVGAIESDMRLDIEEAAGKLGKEFHIVNVLMNDRLQPCRFVCGDPVKAHREGARFCGAMYGRPIDGPADVAIIASDPMDADLRQGMKCFGNVEPGVKDGGLIIGLLECKNGIGDIALPEKSLPNGLLRFILRTIGKNRVLGFIDRVKKGAGIEERFVAHFSMQVVRSKRLMLHSPNLPPDVGKRMGLFRQFDDPAEMMRAAARAAPRKARVLVYPHGGVTYPVLDQ